MIKTNLFTNAHTCRIMTVVKIETDINACIDSRPLGRAVQMFFEIFSDLFISNDIMYLTSH